MKKKQHQREKDPTCRLKLATTCLFSIMREIDLTRAKNGQTFGFGDWDHLELVNKRDIRWEAIDPECCLQE